MNFKTIISLNFFILLFSFNSNAQFWKCKNRKNLKTELIESANPIISEKYKDVWNKYDKLFTEIDSLIDLYQTIEVNKKIEEVLALAQQENEHGYFYKGILYQFGNKDWGEDEQTINQQKWNYLDSIYNSINTDIQPFLGMFKAEFLSSLILNSPFSENKIIDNKSKNPDNWDSKQLNITINELIDSSLILSKNLTFNDVLAPLFKSDTKLDIEGSIEQMFIKKAIDVLPINREPINIYYNAPDIDILYAPISEFIKFNFKESYDPKNDYKNMQLYQELLKNYHIYWDLKRLEFVNARFKNDEKYLKALEELLKKEISNPFSNLISEKIALKIMNKNPKRAHQYLNDAIAKHPNFKFNNNLKEIVAQIEKTVIDASFENTIEPNKKFIGKIEYTNLTTLYITVVKIDYLKFHSKSDFYNISNIDSLSNHIKGFPIKYNKKIELIDYNDFKKHSTEFALDGLDTGSFLIIFSKTSDFNKDESFIGATELISSPYFIVNVNGNHLLYDAINGSIKQGFHFKLYTQVNNTFTEIYKGKTDENGLISLPKNYYWRLILEIGNKNHFSEIYHYSNYKRTKEKESTQFKLLTDRNLYRPGQTVYFKAIAFKNLAKKVIPNETYTVVLRDPNYQEKGKSQLKTNAYGSISGSFELPKTGSSSGNFQIEIINHTSIGFSVEEYKLPKYKAHIIEPTKSYKLNDSVELIGKVDAFAGYPIQNAKVSYTVIRKEFYHNYWNYRDIIPNNSTTLTSVETNTNENGEFKINFKAISDNLKEENTFYKFEINATVTDLNGEVRECTYTLTLSNIDRTISINTNVINIQNNPLIISYELKSLLGSSMPFSGTIECYKIKGNEILKNYRKWSKSDTTLILPFEFNSELNHCVDLHHVNNKELIHTQKFENSNLNEWIVPKEIVQSIGEYQFRIITIDGNGKTITSLAKCLILPAKEGQYNLPKALVIYSLNDYKFEPNQTAKILIGGAVNSHVKISVNSNRGEIFEKTIFINNELELIEIPIKNEDRGGIMVTAFTINNYRNYDEKCILNIPFSNKKINVQLVSFRSDIEPGSKEKWRLKITGPQNEVAKIESAAVMYNQSLDQLFGENIWNNKIYNDYYYNLFDSYRILSELSFLRSKYFNPNEISYSKINFLKFIDILNYDSEFSYFYNNTSHGIVKLNSRHTNNQSKDNLENSVKSIEYNNNSKIKQNEWTKPTSLISTISTPPPIRKNFNETAFFYPHLYADAQGNLDLEFTVPEALTQWRMMLLAHSNTMQIGYLEQSITTSKKVMVQPNIPRFLRQNETIVLSSKIVNTTSSPIQVDAKIEVKNPENGKLFDWCNNAIQKINVAANGVAQVSFKVNIPDYIGLVSITIVAANQQVSDGEEHTLLVVSNRQLITESMPITIRKAGVQNLEFSSLKNNSSNSLKHEKLSVEMSENPAWYAIQALPYMMEYPHECAEQTFTRLYANSIAMYLANSIPEIKKIYDLWVQESKKNIRFQSKLSQNQDLKSVLLEETPWLREANYETQRMQQLGQLFDSKNMNNELEKSFDKLKDMQMDNGAWGWFKGMYPNEYITQTIVIGFGKMNKIGIDITKYQNMINKAMDYLDQEAKKDFEQYKMNPTESFLPSNLQYLYCKSYFPEIGFNNQSEVVNYYINNAEKTWQKSGLMNQAQLLVALKVLKPSSNVPKLIYTAFEQNAKSNPEMGMYWSSNVKAWYWHEAPIETHAAIMEAYKTMDNKKAIKELQIWLLRQKQTQSWSTTRSTADACYALLSNNTFINNQQSVVVSINNKDIKPQQKQAGTGYYRENIEKNDIQNNSGNIKVTAKTDDFAYGALYWQYFEDLDKVKSAASGLSITKKIFKLVNTDKGKERIEVMDTSLLKVGDFIEVVLVVSSDRNLEFVHIKDGRAAGTEPRDVLSQYQWQNGIGYFQSTKDVSTNFFIDQMNKGVYQLSYILKVEQAGVFNSGLATVQCMYAPEFIANSKALVLKVE
jgi:hypothetical protein